MRRAVILAALALAVVGVFLFQPAAAQNPATWPTWSCSVDNIGATLTQCKPAPAPGQRLYVSQIIAQSTTATGGQLLIQYGTGTNCGTGTASLFPSSASVVRIGYPGYASAPTAITFTPPLVPPAGKALCVLAVGTNTVTLHMSGPLGP